MKDLKLIRGAGGGGKGGGGGSRPAEEDPNTLFSATKARIVDLVSEGEIVGLVNGAKSIFINETPLANDAGDKNFEDVSYSTRVGTNSQSYIAGFAGVENEVLVNIEVKIATPGDHIETIITSQLDAVRVLVYTPALTKQDKDDGDMHGSSFSFKFYIEKNNDGTWIQVLSKSFEGKCTSRYERSYRIDIPSSWKTSGFTQIAVKMERITDDAPDASTNNKSFWGSYTQIIDNKLRYPNSALIATQIDARQFNSIPKRGYEIKGLKVKIPSNYTAYDIGYCSNKSGYRRQDRCIQDAGTCSGGNATGSEDYAACIALGGEASWSSSNTWTSQQALCLNAHVDNEWKPYVWVETKTVNYVSVTEEVSELTVTSAFENTPTTSYMWILEEMGSVEAQDFRVLMTRESGPNIVEISALKYHPAKYDYIEEDIAFSSKSTSSLPDPSDPIPSPTNLTISEELYIDSMGNMKNRATFSWDAPNTAGTATTYPYIASYYVEWRRKAPAITNWTSMGETSAQSITIDDAPAGTLEFRVKTRRIF